MQLILTILSLFDPNCKESSQSSSFSSMFSSSSSSAASAFASASAFAPRLVPLFFKSPSKNVRQHSNWSRDSYKADKLRFNSTFAFFFKIYNSFPILARLPFTSLHLSIFKTLSIKLVIWDMETNKLE